MEQHLIGDGAHLISCILGLQAPQTGEGVGISKNSGETGKHLDAIK